MNIYLASAYGTAQNIDKHAVPVFRDAGHSVISTWHHPPYEPENLEDMDDMQCIAIWTINQGQIDDCDALVVLTSPGARETYAEVASARFLGKFIVWVGKPTLSARVYASRDPGRWRTVRDLEGAVKALREFGNGP